MSIAMLGTRGVPATFGGVERHVEEIGSRLVARGHEVTVFSQSKYLGSGGGRDWVREHLGMRVVRVPTLPMKSFEAIAHSGMSTMAAMAGGYDVLHYHAVGPGLAAPLPRYLSGARVVQTIHGLDGDRAKWGRVAQAILNVATWMSARVPHDTVTVSSALAEVYDTRYHRACSTIVNGVTPQETRPADIIRTKYGLNGGDFALFVGRLVPEKRPDLLIRAFAELDTDARLVIVGGSSYTDDYVHGLRRLAARDDRVVMPGFVYGQELEELFTNARALVQPSALEGLPLTLLEAMGSGTPVIASDIAPHREVVGRSRTGARLFADGDLHSLVEALQLVDKDPEAEKRAAVYDASRVARRFDWDTCVDRLEAVYAGTPLTAPTSALELPRAAHPLGYSIIEKEPAA
jgi:glycosyltransferase involved in cell wall biosynthesis